MSLWHVHLSAVDKTVLCKSLSLNFLLMGRRIKCESCAKSCDTSMTRLLQEQSENSPGRNRETNRRCEIASGMTGHISLGASLINELEKKLNSIMWWIKRGTLGIACAVRHRPEKNQPYLSRKWGRRVSDGNTLFKVWQKRGSASKERKESCLRNGGTKSLHKVPLMHSREGWCTPCYRTEGET